MGSIYSFKDVILLGETKPGKKKERSVSKKYIQNEAHITSIQTETTQTETLKRQCELFSNVS